MKDYDYWYVELGTLNLSEDRRNQISYLLSSLSPWQFSCLYDKINKVESE
jgi:hypothetical protein